MPYIDRRRRGQLDRHIDEIVRWIAMPGELNYVISRLLTKLVVLDSIDNPPQVSYHDLSRWRAAVTDAADEFYRRVMAPYEDQKASENGDVYSELLDIIPHDR